MRRTQDIVPIARPEPAHLEGPPQPYNYGTGSLSIAVDIDLPSTRALYLLACMHRAPRGTWLVQERIDPISNDRELFMFMRMQLSRTHSHSWSFLRFKNPDEIICIIRDQLVRTRNGLSSYLCLHTVIGIHFTKVRIRTSRICAPLTDLKFHLRLGNSVEVRPHSSCCTLETCACIPPKTGEYECTPLGPIAAGPPVLSSFMKHQLKHPHLIHENDRSVLHQLPKRTCGQLQAGADKPAEGWGLYYEEGLNLSLIVNLVVGVSVFSSLLFGILWTVLKSDMQGV